MNPLEKRSLGNTGIEVTQLGFGAGTLGDPWEVISQRQAEDALATAYSHGINYFDTSPWYGNGKSEHRVGHFLQSKPRDEFVLTTKVGRVYFRPENIQTFSQSRWKGGLPFDLRFDYRREGIQRSYEDSLIRLGINSVDALLIHDLDLRHQKSEEGIEKAFSQLEKEGGFALLQDMKDRGEIKAIGAGINHSGMIPRFLERFDLDFFLLAMPYTLLNQEALDHEFPLCVEKGVDVVVGAVYGSGILASGPTNDSRYGYQLAEENIKEKVRRMRGVCDRYGIPLAAAALQFPLAHPVVKAVIPGPNSPLQVRQNLEWMNLEIPTALWDELVHEKLLRPDAPVPSSHLHE